MKRKNVSLFVGVLIALIGTVFFMSGCKNKTDESEPVYTRTSMSFEIENKSGVACSVVVTIDAYISTYNGSSTKSFIKEESATSGAMSFNNGEKKTVTINGVLLSGATNQASCDYIHLVKIKASNGSALSPSDYTSGWLQKGVLKSWNNAHFDITKSSLGFIVTKQ